MPTGDPTLVLAAHGSTDPGFATVIEALAGHVRALRSGLEVVIGYLDHAEPRLADVARTSPGAVVVPVLLTSGYHVSTDIPAQAKGCQVAGTLGPDQRIAALLAARLRLAGWDGAQQVVLAAAGSADPAALEDARSAASDLEAEIGASVTTAFLSAGEPSIADLDVSSAAVSTYLLAPGHFATVAARCGAAVVAKPIGADVVLAEIIVDRYDAARLGSDDE